MNLFQRILQPDNSRYKQLYFRHYHEFGRKQEASVAALKNRMFKIPTEDVNHVNFATGQMMGVHFGDSEKDIIRKLGKPDVKYHVPFRDIQLRYFIYKWNAGPQKIIAYFHLISGRNTMMLIETGGMKNLDEVMPLNTSILKDKKAGTPVTLVDQSGNISILETSFSTRIWMLPGDITLFSDLESYETEEMVLKNRYRQLIAASW